jgi:flagellar basal-body rod protein FlgC
MDMDFIKSLTIAASGLRAQLGRMRIIAENIANVDSVAQTPGGDPYRRRIVTFSSELDRSLGGHVVKIGAVETDNSDFLVRHEPGNPAADANGDVKYPNVNSLVEMTDLRDAQRSYEANLNIITATRKMLQRTVDILKS